jgi:ABC-2 type transport system permease protein
MDARATEAQLLSVFYEDHPELLPEGEEADMEEFDTLQWAAEMKVEESLKPILARYDEQLSKQQGQVNRLRFLSPAIVTQEALNEIAGTGLSRYRHFMSGVEAFHEEWRAYFVPKIFDMHEMTGADFDEIPPYRYEEEPQGRVNRYVLVALIGLILPTLGIFALGLLKVRSYPLTG